MINKNKVNKSGFTLVEIIVAGLIISITAGGTFASYLYARQFSDKFRHRAHAIAGAQEIAEYIRYRLADGYRNNVDLAPAFDYGLAAPRRVVTDIDITRSITPTNWGINTSVDNLDISYRVDNVYFDNNGLERTAEEFATVDPAHAAHDAVLAAILPASRPAFKKITVRVTYNNRTVT